MATNEERSRQTRGRILTAAFECIYEKGYSRTTTTEVIRLAEVSRGALLHHFPTREALLAAAVEEVFARQLENFRIAFADFPEEGRAEATIDLLWSIVRGPPYYVWLELVVAARTDPKLLAEVRGVMARFGAMVDAVYQEFFPETEETDPDHNLAPGFAFALINGLAFDRIHADEDSVLKILGVLKRLARELER